MARWRIVITGCGTSHGSPPWGWPEWWSEDPRDHRRRSGAILLGPAGEVVLIDTGPDLMHQLRDPFRSWDGRTYPKDCITRCDALILTHSHADHVHGINDLRHLNRLMGGRSITVLGHAADLAEVQRMFPYCFKRADEFYDVSNPVLSPIPLADRATADLPGGLRLTAFPLSHGPAGRSTGLRVGDLAYCTDVKAIPETSFAHLAGLELLVLGMLRREPHPTHLCWSEARSIIARLRPKRTVLVHLGYEVRYSEWEAILPPDVQLATDGWTGTFLV